MIWERRRLPVSINNLGAITANLPSNLNFARHRSGKVFSWWEVGGLWCGWCLPVVNKTGHCKLVPEGARQFTDNEAEWRSDILMSWGSHGLTKVDRCWLDYLIITEWEFWLRISHMDTCFKVYSEFLPLNSAFGVLSLSKWPHYLPSGLSLGNQP